MHRYALALARLTVSAWIGAALLFVATSVAEQVHPEFDAATKNTLALIRFPWYYGTGFTLLIAAVVSARCTRLQSRARTGATALLLAALVLMGIDYVAVYRPMRKQVSEADSARDTKEFQRLHGWSERINTAGFLLSLAAAATLCLARPASEGRGVEREELRGKS